MVKFIKLDSGSSSYGGLVTYQAVMSGKVFDEVHRGTQPKTKWMGSKTGYHYSNLNSWKKDVRQMLKEGE